MSNLAEIMKKKVKSVQHTTPVSEAAQRMKQDRVSALLVRKNNDFLGILTDTDTVRKGVAESKDLTSMTVESIMTTPFITIESRRSPHDAQELTADSGVRHLIVREGETVIGVVSIRDLLAFYKSLAETEYSEPRIGVD